QDQGQRGDHLQRGRLEGQLHEPQARRAEGGAHQQEDHHQREAGPLHRPGQERGDDDDDPHQGEEGGEALVGHGDKYTSAMPTSEPFGTALLLTTAGILMTASVLFSRASQRIGVPIALLFLLIGMLAGSEGIGGIAFDDYRFAFRRGSLALALILFDGGLNTPLAALRRTWAPASLLATGGVVLTAFAIAVPAHWWGFDWPQALVLGAVVSSTDAAEVFAVLRGSGLQLKRRIGTTLELESGLNDPVAVILTVALSANLVSPVHLEPARLGLEILRELALGAAVGVGIGVGGRELLHRNPLPSGGLYPALTLALALLAYGVTTLLHGSGFLAVYLAGMILGNAPLPYHTGLLRVHDALAWLAQIGMFLVLGLLVFPSGLFEVAGIGLGLALILAIVVRPAIVGLCLAPFRYPWRETLYIGWVGLRGAVPIVLATYRCWWAPRAPTGSSTWCSSSWW